MPITFPSTEWGNDAFDNIATGQAATTYQEARDNFIKEKENATLAAGGTTQGGQNIRNIHNGGGDGNPTIGYGFNLNAHDYDKIEAYLTHAFGGFLTQLQQDGLDIIEGWKDGTNGLTAADIIAIAQGNQGTQAQRDALQSLQMTDAEATILLDADLDGHGGFVGRETNITNTLGSGDLAPSVERIMIVSLHYNNPVLLGPGLIGALQSSDTWNRAEAWFQIRYFHQDFNEAGIQARRAEEATLFGLVSSNPDAAALTEERKIALSYLFTERYAIILGRDANDPFLEAIAEELNALQDAYTTGADVDFVQTDGVARALAAAGVAEGKTAETTRNLIFGQDGKDNINGEGGNDFLYGGDGDDTLVGGKGDDLLHGGDLGLAVGPADGIDTADYSTSINAIDADLQTGTVSDGLGGTDKLVSIEKIIGSGYNDNFRSDESYQSIDGGGGNDTVDYSDFGGQVDVDLENGSATFPSGTLQELKNIESVTGSIHNDEIDGHTGENILIALGGDDTLFGGGGRDFLFGGDGNDALHGDDDTDLDILVGGAGADDFYIGANDIVLDLDLDDRVFINGVQVEGGIIFGFLDDETPENGEYENDDFAIGLQGEAYFPTYTPTLLDGTTPGSLTVVLPGAEGAAFLFGIQQSEFWEDSGSWEQPTTYPGGISIDESHPEEYFSIELGWYAPEYADAAYAALYANGYTNKGPGAPDLINSITEGAYEFLHEAGYADVDGVWTGPGLAGSGGSGSGQISFPQTNHAPISIGLSANKVDENAEGAVIGSITVSDLDGQGGHAFSLSDTRFEIVNGELRLKAGQSLDYETEQTIALTVTATDSSGLSVQNVLNLLVRDQVEELYGTSGDDLLITGIGVDKLYGLEGNDTLDGGAAADTLVGGSGNDAYIVDDPGDLTIENADEGTDTVQSTKTWTLAANIENLILAGTVAIDGTGNDLSNTIQGNTRTNQIAGLGGDDALFGGDGSDVLAGGDGNDALDGGTGNDTLDGGAGADLLTGGTGNDKYIVDDAADQIVEGTSEGTDLVTSSVSWTLSANVEQLTLAGTANLTGTGNELANTITGNGGDNALDGGLGNDKLIGGQGNDTYFVDSTSDVVTELAGEGIDQVVSTVTLTLGTQLENLTLLGSGNVNGTGNSLANIINGNAGNNVLDGGAGNDRLSGAAGDDTYVVNSAGDIVAENPGEGIDLVKSSATVALAANIENLTLTGSSAINGTGNELDNVLVGNSGANQLTGGEGNDRLDGAAGNDKMLGGLGDDTYVVQAGGDVVTEGVGEGIDTVESSITISALAANVERLTLTGTGAINGTGNGLDNVITGNGGANTLTGGAGNDALQGGSGIDSLVGGDGNDALTWDGADTLNGGNGLDTLLFGSTGTLLFDSGRMVNLEAIDLGAGDDNNNGVALSVADVMSWTSSSGGTGIAANGDDVDLFILGDAEGDIRDDVNLSGGWTANGTVTTSALNGTETTFSLYIASGTQVAVQQGLELAVA